MRSDAVQQLLSRIALHRQTVRLRPYLRIDAAQAVETARGETVGLRRQNPVRQRRERAPALEIIKSANKPPDTRLRALTARSLTLSSGSRNSDESAVVSDNAYISSISKADGAPPHIAESSSVSMPLKSSIVAAPSSRMFGKESHISSSGATATRAPSAGRTQQSARPGETYSSAEPRRPAATTHRFLLGKPRRDERNPEMSNAYSLPVSAETLGSGRRSHQSPQSPDAR